MTVGAPPGRERIRGEGGAAMVEMSVVIGLLLFLVLGAISFGVLLARQHVLQEAATEGARAAIGSPATPSDPTAPEDAARARIEDVLDETGACTSDPALTCDITIDDCGGADAGHLCATVEVTHDRGVDPIVGELPLVERAMPDDLGGRAVVRLD